MKVVITGSTGMVGKGVLLECLERADVEEVLVINRSSLDINHPKLKEVILKDLLQVDTIKDQFKGYDACLH
jgi:putative NADH-flavin reductase